MGESGHAAATVVQGEGEAARKVPVGWPVSADWSGSGGLCVKFGAKYGPSQGSSRAGTAHCTATYDPRDGTLTALRPGTVTLTVDVNGERAERQVKITR